MPLNKSYIPRKTEQNKKQEQNACSRDILGILASLTTRHFFQSGHVHFGNAVMSGWSFMLLRGLFFFE